MADNINREKVEGISDVYSVEYTQDIENPSELNRDVIKDKTLYYTDLDTSEKAELFLTPSEAKKKADDMIRKFPNHIVKFYMFYYTEVYDNQNNLNGVKQELCQVVPGTQDPNDAKYRNVKRKNLKKVYDKVDFITIYRPLNGIKWYTVSREELEKELAVIKEFYGLTNFPDKTGDFYFSKKIGKWLATNELAEILAGYEASGQKVPVIYIDEFENGYIKARKKSVLETIWDYIVGFFTSIGDFFGSLLGIDDTTRQQRFQNFIDGLKDEDGNWIPDGLDNIISKYKINVINPDFIDIQNAIGGNSGTLLDRINSIIGSYSGSIFNMINNIKDTFTNQKDGWFSSFWSNIRQWANETFGWNLPQ